MLSRPGAIYPKNIYQKDSEKMSNKVQKWYFTFGHGQEHFGKYVMFTGTFSEARDKMIRRFGRKWAMQYSEEEFEGQPEKWGYKELK